jgi:tRNA A22 N-methylase
MGGELIADIIDTCEYVKKSNIRLILQPMTSIYELRSYLKNEFDWIEQNFITYKESIQSNLQQKDEFFSTNETPLEKLKTTSPLLAKKIVLV